MTDTPTIGSTLPSTHGEGPGGFVGPFKLLGQIGEGGFGLVYEAEQTHPVKRRVALKVIKIGMDTLDFVARFEAERQVLALMDHPHIAKVFGAGASDDGRPYFVMELVKGEAIDSYCARHKLPINARLQLFGQVCEAVQHAHSKGIIHRDLKPNNVLVSTQDDRPFAKVIDFGIAKAMSGHVGQRTLFTEQGMLIGTPLYMSPEQAEGSADIDTRADIYALGVMLYQLLTGTTPIHSDTLRRAAQGEIQRIIREVDPPSPSKRLDGSAETLRQAAMECQMTPHRLRNAVRGELDWIVMKAIEKERSRRYETANGIVADVRRFLAGEPVLAAPPSALYRTRKFVRRNKVLASAAALIVLSLMGGLSAALWQARIAQEQTRIAEARSTELEQMADFQEQMFERIDPAEAGQLLSQGVLESFKASLRERHVADADQSAQVLAFEAHWRHVNATDQARTLIDGIFLAPAVAAIEQQFIEQPRVEAGLYQAMADRYLHFGQYDKALPLNQRALTIRRRVLGEDHLDTLASLMQLGWLLQFQGRLDEAEPLFRDGLARTRRVLGEDHVDTLTTLASMAYLLHGQGKIDEAEALFRDALTRSRRVLGEGHDSTLTTSNNLAMLLYGRGKLDEAAQLFLADLAQIRRVMGEDHPDTLTAINNLASVLRQQGKFDEAEPLFRDCLVRRRRVLGDNHPHTLATINNLASLLSAQGKLDEAEPLYVEGLARSRQALGDDHRESLVAFNNLASLLESRGKLDEAEAMYRDVLARMRRVLGEDHPYALATINNLASVLRARGKLDEADPLFRDGLARRQRVLGEDHPDALASFGNLALLVLSQGKLEEAELMYRDVLDRSQRALGENHPYTLTSNNNLAKLLHNQGKLEEAEPLLRNSLERRRRVLGEDHPDTLSAILDLGRLLLDRGRLDEAERVIREEWGARARVLGAEHRDNLISMLALARLLNDKGEPQETIELLQPVEDRLREVFAELAPHHVGQGLTQLGRAHAALGGWALAEPLLLEAHSLLLEHPGPDPQDFRRNLLALVQLYSHRNATESADRWNVKAMEWQATLDKYDAHRRTQPR